MAVDYKQQYRPDQLEKFWPNEIFKMLTAVLCTLAIIMFFAILPVLLEVVGLRLPGHQEAPANPKVTPVGIKPEWYFLAVYQYLRLMPQKVLGISGKTVGVLSQGVGVAVILLLPFWYRRGAHKRPGWAFRLIVTAGLFGFLGLMIWGGWPEEASGRGEELIPLSTYVQEQPMMFAVIAVGLVVFYALIAREVGVIRRILHGPPPLPAAESQPPADKEHQP